MCFILSIPQIAAAENITTEKWSREILNDKVGVINRLINNVQRPVLKSYLEDVRDSATSLLESDDISDKDGIAMKRALDYAIKMANDIQNAEDVNLWSEAPFVMYEVPALSPIFREIDVLPEDGTLGKEVNVISAQGEYEAASFILAPMRDTGNVTFEVSDLTGEAGTIPADSIDLRVVKYWYQGGTAWHSYFADTNRNVMVPELLLHDESLIKVDREKEINYVRVDYPEGSQYVNISTNPAQNLSHFDAPIEDSPVLLPVSLKQGESKQMWITTYVPKGTAAGLYTGNIKILADGKEVGTINLNIRVLPFELPDPKTNYDINKDFYTMIYYASRYSNYMISTNGNTKLVEDKLRNVYNNLYKHNVVNLPGPLLGRFYTDPNARQYFERQLQLMQEAGMKTDPLFCVYQTFPTWSDWTVDVDKYKQELKDVFDYVTQVVGHTNIYFDSWDEAGWTRLQNQAVYWDYIQKELGAKVYATGNDTHLELDVKENFLNWAGEPTREKADAWHAFGEDKIITNYAYPHSGPENPDLTRQRHGMWLYKANYDATYNYIYYEGAISGVIDNIWNDNSLSSVAFRNFNWVYPTKTSVIDTIAWEGFREGIDDIKYATKLRQLAHELKTSASDTRQIEAAEEALNWLDNVNERETSSDLLRLEMIRHILNMLEVQNAQ